MASVIVDFLLLMVAVTFLNLGARRLPLPLPITLTLGGFALAFLPGFRDVQLDPELFFIAFLPPLLFSDGWLIPLRELARVRGIVTSLALGLVLLTTAAVAFVAHALVPGLSWGMAFALGALVSPTDAVAVSAVTAKLPVPERLNAALNGESMLNDASGLVAFRFALAAVAAGGIAWQSVATSFVVLALGGSLLGLALGFAIGKFRDWLNHVGTNDPITETSVSIMTPFAAYFLADWLGVSAVLAIVVSGLYSGWRDPVKMDVATRQRAWAVWETALFWLNGAAFVLLGLTAPSVWQSVAQHYSWQELVLWPTAITAVLIACRALWMLPMGVPLPRRHGEPEALLCWKSSLVGTWAGMRGSVTLAAALSIPFLLPNGDPMPGRDIVIHLALGVVILTLVLHGTTLEPLIRWLRFPAENHLELEEREARLAAVRAGLEALRDLPAPLERASAEALQEVIREYEHRLNLLTGEGETAAEACVSLYASRRWQLHGVLAERATLDRLWRDGVINDTIHRPLQFLLDHEEAMLRTKGVDAE